MEVNNFGKKTSVLKIDSFESNGTSIPSLVIINNVDHVFFEECDDSYYAKFISFFSEDNDIFIRIGGKQDDIKIVIKRYKSIIDFYNSLVVADGGIVYDVKF